MQSGSFCSEGVRHNGSNFKLLVVLIKLLLGSAEGFDFDLDSPIQMDE